MSTTLRARALAVAVVLSVVAALSLTACDPPLLVGTPVGPVAAGCTLNIAGRACYEAHSGVPGLTAAQITGGLTELTHTVGDRDITTDGTVIDKQWIDGCVAIHANNVTIKNSYIRTSSWCHGGDNTSSPAAISTGGCHTTGQQTGLVIQDSEIDAGNVTSDYVGIGACNFTLLRVNVHGGTQPVWAGHTVTIAESYLHDPTTAAAPNHTEALNADSGDNIYLHDSWLSAVNSPQAGSQTGALAINNSYGAAHDIIVQNNFLEGANGVDVTFGGGGGRGCTAAYCKPWGFAYGVWFVGNHLSPNSYPFPQYGWVSSYTESIGMSWTGNVQSETGATVNP